MIHLYQVFLVSHLPVNPVSRLGQVIVVIRHLVLIVVIRVIHLHLIAVIRAIVLYPVLVLNLVQVNPL